MRAAAVGIYRSDLAAHRRGNGRFCTAVTRMPAARIAVPDLPRVFTAIESGGRMAKSMLIPSRLRRRHEEMLDRPDSA